MFRSLSGFKAQYQNLTLLVVSEFNEWKVLVYAPGVTIHGFHQFGEAKAKEHALAVVENYLREVKHEEPTAGQEVDWQATAHDDYLVWRA